MAKCPKCRKIFGATARVCAVWAVLTVPLPAVQAHSESGGQVVAVVTSYRAPAANPPLGYVPFEPRDRPEMPDDPLAQFSTYPEIEGPGLSGFLSWQAADHVVFRHPHSDSMGIGSEARSLGAAVPRQVSWVGLPNLGDLSFAVGPAKAN